MCWSFGDVAGCCFVCVHRMLDDWCRMRWWRLHCGHVEVPVGLHVHCVVSVVVGYGSVKGVCGFVTDRVVPILAMASLSMSPVDFPMSRILVTLVMAVLVRLFAWSIFSRLSRVGVVAVRAVVRCFIAVGDDARAASTFAAMRSVREKR